MLIFSTASIAFNLGSFQRTGESKVIPGEQAHFELILWTAENSTVEIEFTVVEKPENWNVNINPARLSINSSSGSQIIALESGYVRATPVSVDIFPEKNSLGENRVRISAKASVPRAAAYQERFFTFKVFVGDEASDGTGGFQKEAFIILGFIIIISVVVLLLILAYFRMG